MFKSPRQCIPSVVYAAFSVWRENSLSTAHWNWGPMDGANGKRFCVF